MPAAEEAARSQVGVIVISGCGLDFSRTRMRPQGDSHSRHVFDSMAQFVQLELHQFPRPGAQDPHTTVSVWLPKIISRVEPIGNRGVLREGSQLFFVLLRDVLPAVRVNARGASMSSARAAAAAGAE
jgi:hypothetical protein